MIHCLSYRSLWYGSTVPSQAAPFQRDVQPNQSAPPFLYHPYQGSFSLSFGYPLGESAGSSGVTVMGTGTEKNDNRKTTTTPCTPIEDFTLQVSNQVSIKKELNRRS